MTKEEFFNLLSEEVKTYKTYLETDGHDWIVKGFVDVNKNVYTITNDTKVVSKIIEILPIPKLDKFANDNGLVMELPSKQNFYPDLTFKDNSGNLFAVDFKSSYYSGDSVNGLTLGSYWGYFRDRDTVKIWIIRIIRIFHTTFWAYYTKKALPAEMKKTYSPLMNCQSSILLSRISSSSCSLNGKLQTTYLEAEIRETLAA